MEPPAEGASQPDDITLGRERIGRNIQYYRKLRGLKQINLAPLLDYTQGTLSKIERGKYPLKVDWLIRAATVLEVDLEDLTRRDLPPSI